MVVEDCVFHPEMSVTEAVDGRAVALKVVSDVQYLYISYIDPQFWVAQCFTSSSRSGWAEKANSSNSP